MTGSTPSEYALSVACLDRLTALRDRDNGMDSSGLQVLRALHPDEQAFSWWDYRGGAFHRRHGLRIDLLLATESAAKRASAAGIDRDWRKKHDGLTPSDHAPVVVDLD